MDGLVSTGKYIPIAILKIISSNKKNFERFFMHILKAGVDISTDFILSKLPQSIRLRNQFQAIIGETVDCSCQ